MKRHMSRLLSGLVVSVMTVSQIPMNVMAMDLTAKEYVAAEVLTEAQVVNGVEAKAAVVEKLPTSALIKATASEELTYAGYTHKAGDAIDGNKGTFWGTTDFALNKETPTYITVELEQAYPVKKLGITARQDHTNGGIKQYELWLGTEEGNLQKVKEGDLGSEGVTNSPTRYIELDQAVEAKYVKLVAKTGVAANVCLAELDVYKEIPEGQDTALQTAEYRLGDGAWQPIALATGQTTYAIEVDPFNEVVPEIRVATRDNTATVAYEQLTTGTGSAKAVVTSGNGENTATYSFNFVERGVHTDATLKVIQYNRKGLEGFAPGKKDYNVILDKGTTKVDILAVANDAKAKVTINDVEVNGVYTLPITDTATATIKVTAEDRVTVETYTVNFTVNENEAALKVYEQDFDAATEEDINWRTIKGNPVTTSLVDAGEGNKKLQVRTTGVTTSIDENSPDILNGEYKMNLTIKEGQGRFGFAIRTQDQDNWGAISYDVGNWVWQSPAGYGGLFNYNLENNKEYEIKIQFLGTNIKVYIDGERVYNGAVGQLPQTPGKVGLYTWHNNKIMEIDNLSVVELREATQPARPENAEEIALTNGDMQINVDSTFPIIYDYTVGGTKAFEGQQEYTSAVSINGTKLFAENVTSTQVNDKTIEYTMPLKGILDDEEFEAVVKTQIEVKDDNIIEMKVTDIQEVKGPKIFSLEFSGQQLVTLKDPNGGYGAVKAGGGWHQIGDTEGFMKDLGTGSADIEKESLTYPFIYNSDYAISIDNNVMNPENKISLVKDHLYKNMTFGSGAFTYREVPSDVAVNAGLNAVEDLPVIKIKVTPDANGDGTLDWQDGAIAFRDIVKVPQGAERIKDTTGWIAMNFVSNAGSPFLRVLDIGKLMSYYMDGFGQRILNKGYQGEGHDDSIPDYANIGVRAGGTKDFNVMADAGEAYNLDIGVHVNATEYILDAVNTKLENLSGGELGKLSPGWGWLDQAYYVDQRKDVTTGELERRIDELHQAVPGMDFIYVDVYTGAGWNAKQFAKMMNERGWYVATEFGGPFEGDQVWTHWGTDLYYPNTDAQSDMYRFIFNHQKDMFAADSMLKGMQMPSISAWNIAQMYEGVETFYNQNLPTKYMQYSPIMKMTDDRIDFENGSYVEQKGDKVNLYSKDKNLIAEMSTAKTRGKSKVFIPWSPETEEKIYHWNYEGGSTTWSLPNSWDGLSEVHVFELEGNGRVYKGTVPVVGGEVTLTAQKDVPYIIAKNDDDVSGLPEDPNWGEGSLVKDPGFNRLAFGEEWEKSSTAENTDHITMERIEDTKDKHAFDNKLMITGKEDARISQSIKGLEPGKTYTVSAWINTERETELVFEMDGETYKGSIDNNKVTCTMPQHRYNNTKYQRVRFDVTVPEGVTTAQLSINVPVSEVEGKVIVDDIRIFEQPGFTDRNKDGAVYYEDFENVDEGWGPFEYNGSGSGMTHLAYKDPQGRQIKNYTIEGEWSLKSNEDKVGDILVTRPYNIKLEPNTEYTVTLDHAIYGDNKGINTPGNPDKPYVMSAKDGAGNVLVTTTLTNSTIDENNIASHDTATITFNTGDREDVCIAIGAPVGRGGNILILDNFKIVKSGEVVEPVGITPVLTVEDSVKAGEDFKVIFGVENDKDPIYAADLKVTYDPNLFTYEGVEKIDPTVFVGEEVLPENIIRLITANDKGVQGRLDLLALNFKAADVEGTQVGNIGINESIFATVVDGVDAKVPVDGIQKAISVVGEQTPPPNPNPEDVNEDKVINVADLALVAYYFQAKENDTNWEEAKKADINGDGKVDIDDLARIASKILE